MRRKAKRIATIVLLLIMLFADKAVQSNQAKLDGIRSKRININYALMLRGAVIDLGALNSNLEKRGYPEFSNNFFNAVDAGIYKIINGVVFGIEAHSLLSKEAANEKYKISINGTYTFVDLGYVLYAKRDLIVYPIIGIGYGGVNLGIIESKLYSFEKVLNNPDDGVELSRNSYLLNLAVGIDYLLKARKNKRFTFPGLAFGLRLGYNLAPIKRNWKIHGVSISDGPKAGIMGPYIRIIMGVWSG